ncbi:MAG: ParB/RepB/Spo0J family partition protein [Roseiflexus sp.]|nr:ParB/RepB/Spo0J family partition protein [Roseiflexus sp.]MCS7288585.1 ParB/RepB/Spo0J family partition protein [Roseiflexus sp.]MDW8145276.1 ParB/RepB/Spo0J family partition protein [Roseiflexaceae bacterium]MDW8232034.1 ParB/RepB/Spo0J family partition protein [Roseiflexaceae bacterium]
MKRPRGLGSGLAALIPSDTERAVVREILTDSIDANPYQPRTDFDEAALEELAASIREHGIIQPLIVTERESGRYELIAGERRLRAARRAGLDRVPVIVRESTHQQALEIALIENIQRADLNALEEARAYQTLKDEFGLSDEAIAQRVGRSREAVANTRRLLGLAPVAQQALLAGRISAGHGRALLKLTDKAAQEATVAAIIDYDLNVREVERLTDYARTTGDIHRALSAIRPRLPEAALAKRQRASRSTHLSPDDQNIRRELERLLGTPVSLVRTERELRVTIVFHTEEKVQEFFDRLSMSG